MSQRISKKFAGCTTALKNHMLMLKLRLNKLPCFTNVNHAKKIESNDIKIACGLNFQFK